MKDVHLPIHDHDTELQEHIRRREFELEILQEISSQLSFSLDYEHLVNLLIEKLHKIVPGSVYAGLIRAETGYELVALTQQPLSIRVKAQIETQMLDTFAQLGGNWIDEAHLTVQSKSIDPYTAPVDMSLRSTFQVPIISEKQIVGLIYVGSEEEDAFDAEHLRVVYTAAEQAAHAIQRLHNLLNAERQQLERLFENLPDGVVMLNAEREIAFMNPFGQYFIRHLTSIDPNDRIHRLAGRPIDDLVTCCDDPVQWWEMTGEGRVFQVAVRRIQEGSQSGGYYVVIHDITESKQVEKQLQQLLERERELSQFKSQLIAKSSHEFRTPLTTILSSSELLRRYRDKMNGEKQDQHHQKIAIAVKHMTDILEELLLVAKAEAGQLPFNPQPVNMAELFEQVIHEVRQTTATQCHIEVLHHAACDNNTVDPTLTRQIITNLLSNAIKYSPEGSTITCRLHCDYERVRLEIQDEGIGIPSDEGLHIFEPFHRAPNVADIQGTGLGLTVVRECVAVHGGSIHFESQPGQGTTFIVELPRVYGQSNDEQQQLRKSG